MRSLLLSFLDQEQANLIFCMLMTIPLSFLLYLIKQKYLFLALSMSITLAFQSLLFPQQKYFLWAQQQIVYLIIMFCPRKIVGHAVLGQSFVALAFVQIRRIYISYGVNGVDITGIFMMQLFNWVGMAYNYQNGIKDPSKLTDDARRRSIKQRPNYITYLGYVNFLPACLIGPVYEYVDYENYLNRTNDYTQIPSPLRAMTRQTGIFLVSVIVYAFTLRFQIEHILTQQFKQYNLFMKLLYISVNIFNIQLKYVSAWSLGMISMKASGFTYYPQRNHHNKDGTIVPSFNRIQVTDFVKFYLEPSLKVKAQGWNMTVQNALKKYIYQQIYDPTVHYKDQKQRKRVMNKAQMVTLMTSALWHGFYLGYFITFFHWGLCLQISNQFFRFRTKSESFKKIWKKHQFLFKIVENYIWTVSITYFGMAVHLMIWQRISVYIYTTYAAPYIVLYIAYFLIMEMRVLAPKQKQKQVKSQQKKKNDKEHTN